MGDEGAPMDIEIKGVKVNKPLVRTYQEELKYLNKINPYCYEIKKGFVPGMNCTGNLRKWRDNCYW